MDSSSKTPLPFGARDYSSVLKEGLKYIEDRMTGRITSFRTPWAGLNRAGIGGIEWGNLVTIGARPGSGKTLVVSQILREAKMHNPNLDLSILEFQLEMGAKQYAARQFAAEVALDYNQVLSSDKALSKFYYEQMQRYIADCEMLEKQKVYRKMIGKPLTSSDMEKAIRYYYEAMGGKPTIVTIDHSWLIKKSAAEKEKIHTLYNTVEMLMTLKNELPIIVFMITQMNRTMEEVHRLVPGSVANYPTSSDVFGGDALMQGSDMVLVLNRPAKMNISHYGTERYEVTDEQVYMHMLKQRNSSDSTSILFMKGELNRQRIIEVPEFTKSPLIGGGSRGNGYRGGYGSTRTVTADIGKEL